MPFVKYSSHRSRERLEYELKRDLVLYYCLYPAEYAIDGRVVAVTEDEFERALSVKGVTRCRIPEEYLRQCIKWN